MITVISDNREILKLHKQFHKQLDEHLTKKIRCSVGYQGGSNNDSVKYYAGINLWMIAQELNNKFWNGFGIGEPSKKGSNSLVCEINFPYDGIDRRIAGAFAQDDRGRSFILHRGSVGGGKKGVGKNAFLDHFQEDLIRAIDGDKETNFCPVLELRSSSLPQQLCAFVQEVRRIKDLINNGRKE